MCPAFASRASSFPHLHFFFPFLASAITPGYILIPEAVELGTTDEGESVVFVFLGLFYLTQYNIFYSTDLPADFIISFSLTAK